MKKILTILLTLIVLASCKTHYAIREVTVYDSIFINKIKTDTVVKVKETEKEVYILDSLLVIERNDTVYVERFRSEIRNEHIKDSIYEHKLDSLQRQIERYRSQSKVNTIKPHKSNSNSNHVIIFIVFILIALAIKIYNNRD